MQIKSILTITFSFMKTITANKDFIYFDIDSIKVSRLNLSTDALLFFFFTLYTVAHLVNTTLHSYVNKCTTILEKIYLPRCSWVGRTQASTTAIPDIGT